MNKNRKNSIFTFVTLLILVSIVVACTPQTMNSVGETPVEKPANTPEVEETAVDEGKTQREFNIMGSSRVVPGEEEAWEEVIADFEKEYDVNVNMRWQGEWSDIPEQLAAARLAGEKVDITTVNANNINAILVRSGLILDITSFVEPFRDRIHESMYDSYTINGRLWGMPWDNASSSVIFYNKTMFDELGLSVPQTYSELLEVAKVIQEEKGIMPWVHQGKAPYMWPMWFFETLAQTSGNKSIEYTNDFLSGKRKFTSAEEVAAFEAIKKFYDDGVLTEASLDTDPGGMRAAFAQQQAAMMYVGTWEFPNMREMVTDFEVGMFSFPTITNDPAIVAQHGGGPDRGLAVPSFAPPENHDLQMQFLEFVSREENANKILGPAQAFIPVVKSVPSVDDPLTTQLLEEFVPNTIKFLDWIWPVEVNNAVMNGIPAVMVGAMTAEEAAAEVQRAFDTLVAEKDYSFDWWTSWTENDWEAVTPTYIPEIEVKE